MVNIPGKRRKTISVPFNSLFFKQVQTALWSYNYINSLMATIFLTLERYLYVTKPFTYKKVKKKIMFAVFFPT